MIAYTNQIKIVLDGIEKLIEGEMNIPVLPEHAGTESIVILPVSDELIDHLATAHVRSYDVMIEYNMDFDEWDKAKDHMTARAERIKRLLFNNSNYSPDNTYKWHDGNVLTITYEDGMAKILFSCVITESL